MASSLAVNPVSNPRKRRRRRKSTKRRRSTRRRRRYRNPSSLRIVNPRGGMGGMMSMIQPAAMVAAGQVIGQVLPAKLLKMDATKPRSQRALAAIGVGVIGMAFFSKFVGRQNAKYLGLGAMASGIGAFLQNILPPDWRISGGLGQGAELVTEADIDEEIRKMAGAGVADYEVLGDSGMGYPEDDVSMAEGLGQDDDWGEETIPSTF